MDARIVIVHEETAFLDVAKAALQAEGYEVDAYEDPTRAASALHAPGKLEVLIAEARTPRRRDGPGISIRIIAAPGEPAAAKVMPVFLPDPVPVPKILEVVRDLLDR
jgi:DNA-binding NtrC family response regulator